MHVRCNCTTCAQGFLNKTTGITIHIHIYIHHGAKLIQGERYGCYKNTTV